MGEASSRRYVGSLITGSVIESQRVDLAIAEAAVEDVCGMACLEHGVCKATVNGSMGFSGIFAWEVLSGCAAFKVFLEDELRRRLKMVRSAEFLAVSIPLPPSARGSLSLNRVLTVVPEVAAEVLESRRSCAVHGRLGLLGIELDYRRIGVEHDANGSPQIKDVFLKVVYCCQFFRDVLDDALPDIISQTVSRLEGRSAGLT